MNTSVARPVVLDTNVVLDLMVFRDPGVEPIARAIRSGIAVPVTTRDCVDELRRVLAYPRLNLEERRQSEVLEQYTAQSTLWGTCATTAPAGMPLCTDRDDQKFLELAWHSHAHCLVTKDRALLRMARAVAKLGRFTVLGPQKFEAYFHAA